MSSHTAPGTDSPRRKPVTLNALRELHARGEPVAMVTCYDASFAVACDEAGVDSLLVGDSLGMVVQGHASTLPVTLEQVAYHTACVARVKPAAWLVADLPFGSYHEGMAQAVRSSVALVQAGAQMVKLEGGGWTPELVRALVERGIPVCGHLGLTPQSVHALGGYRIQGRTEDGAATLVRHARELRDAGAAMVVLELMPTTVAQQVQAAVPEVITIGIGAGNVTAGQVLVLQDLLGLTRGRLPRFVRNFMEGAGSLDAALKAYVAAVKDRSFPDNTVHGY